MCIRDRYLRDVGLSADDLWTPFSSLPMVLVYNTRLVPEGEVTGWADLLDPRWKGRIAFADPTVSGSGYTAALTLFSCIEGDDWDILAELVANLDGGELPDSGDVVESVRSGSRYIGEVYKRRRLHRHRRLRLLPLPVRHREQPAALDRLRLHRLHDLHGRRLLRLGQGHRRLLLQPDRRR